MSGNGHSLQGLIHRLNHVGDHLVHEPTLAITPPSMPGWTWVGTHPTQGRTFQRPLDTTELSFLWDGLFNGTADNIQYYRLRLVRGSQDLCLFSAANIVRAWLSTKRRYPLAGATVRGASPAVRPRRAAEPNAEGNHGNDDGGGDGDNSIGFVSEPHFVVREHDLSTLRPHEIVFGRVTGAEDARRRAAAILNDGPRPLSDDLLVQLHVYREMDANSAPGGGGTSDVLHLMTVMAHCVTDGMANNTFLRCLLDTLARGGGSDLDPDLEPAQVPLEERLAMAVSTVELEPVHLRALSPARRRWRRAVGIVIFQLKMAKRQGGHTLPCRLTRSTSYVPARSARVATSLTEAQTATVIANCRLHNVTFGNAYLPLAQVAMTRVLYRRYLRGDISEEEWAYRQRQPHISGGPLNLRPYLDKAWHERGGGGEFMLLISFFFYQLPFMTLGATAEGHSSRHCECDRELALSSDGAPPFSDLLTFDRFLHRAELVKRQAAAFFNHPLFFEIVQAASLFRIEHKRLGALQWMKRVEAGHGDRTRRDPTGGDEILAAVDMPMVWAHGGSSFGSVDLVSPSEYPLPQSHPLSPDSSVPHPVKAGYADPPSFSSLTRSDANRDTSPKIVVEHAETHLHARPAELYLGAASSRGQLRMHVFHDANVYEEGVVEEWLDEVKQAVLWYLGRAHQPCRAPKSQTETGLRGGVQAKM